MALTKSSALMWWSSRYGINPRIGGRPVFSRNSAGSFTTQEGEIDQAIVNTNRMDWATLNLPSGLTERRKVLSLELASTNIIDVDFASWTLTTVTPTTGQADPAGGALAQLLNSTVAGGSCTRVLTYTSGTKAYSLRLKAGTATTGDFGIYSNTASLWRGLVHIAWSGGVPTLSVSSGSATLFPVRALGGGYYEIQIAIPGVVGSDTNVTYFYPGGNGTTGSVYSYRPQVEALGFCTSAINGFSATRAKDLCSWNFAPLPQAMMSYTRFIESGNILGSSGRPFWITNPNSNPPVHGIYTNAGMYEVYHHNGTAAAQVPMAVAPSYGDTVELVAMLYSDGHVRLIQSINSAAVSDSGSSGANALQPAWSVPTQLYVNSDGSTGEVGSSKNTDFKIVKFADVVASTAQGIMDELRAFELGPNADVL